MSSFKLSGKTCIVTGGAGGLGKSIAKALLDEGANVVIVDINKSLLDSASKELGSTGKGAVLGLEANIADEKSVESLFEQAVSKFGQVDVLVNNAGIMDHFDPVGDLDKSLWDKVIAVNLTAPYMLTKAAVGHFLSRSATDAAIVNVGSLSSKGGFFAGAAYTASKHGLLGLTKNTAAYYRDKGIRCNIIMPTGMQTNIGTAFLDGRNEAGMKLAVTAGTALKAGAAPTDDVARVVVFLSSEASSTLNGAAISVDKGFTSTF